MFCITLTRQPTKREQTYKSRFRSLNYFSFLPNVHIASRGFTNELLGQLSILNGVLFFVIHPALAVEGFFAVLDFWRRYWDLKFVPSHHVCFFTENLESTVGFVNSYLLEGRYWNSPRIYHGRF
jgi:hypothetical protein